MSNKMKIFTNNKFTGYYPVGTAAVIIAKDKHDAARLLSNQLSDMGLDANIEIENMIEVNHNEQKCIILNDGNY